MMEKQDLLERYFDQVADYYDAMHYTPGASITPRGLSALACLEELFAGRASCACLDLGCGTGHVLAMLLRQGHDALGIDVSEAMLAQCRGHLKAEKFTEDRVRKASLMDLSMFEDSSFDYAFAIEVLEYLDQESFRQALAEIRRVLKPGAALIASFPNSLHQLFQLDRTTLDFFRDNFLACLAYPDSDARAALELTLQGLLTCPEEPVEGFPGSEAYQQDKLEGKAALLETDLPRRFMNPLTLAGEMAGLDFMLEDICCYRIKPFPELLKHSFPLLYHDLAIPLEKSLRRDWRAMFMAEYCMAVLRVHKAGA